MSLCGYFDASGGHGGIVKGRVTPSTLIAGFYASGKNWKKFDADWNVFLTKYGLTHLHVTDLYAGRKEHIGWSEDKQEQVILEAIKIIKKYVKFGNSQTINYSHFKEIETKIPQTRQLLHSDYFFCFNSIIQAGAEWAIREKLTDKINYFIEHDDLAKEQQVLRAFNRVLDDPQKKDELRLGSITFAEKKAVCGLQAADLLANLMYKETYRQMYEKTSLPYTRDALSILVQTIPGAYEQTPMEGMILTLLDILDGKA